GRGSRRCQASRDRITSYFARRNMRFLVRPACFLVPILAALAQSDRRTITGTILDPVAAVVPGAKITATNADTAAQYATVSTSTDTYPPSQLPAGTYELSAQALGFNRFVQQGIRVFVGGTERVDVTLQVGGATESVTVSADASLLKTETAEQSTSI